MQPVRHRLVGATLVAVGLAALVTCSSPPKAVRRAATKAQGAFTLSIVGTNDLHGALERLPILGGYVANLRSVRAADAGAVMMIDAGDMFQGTLESNIAEGADVIKAYNQLGYTAAAVGNHEFDFGPPGPAVTAQTPEEDPRGALKARAQEASFPLLTANILDAATNERIKWPNMPASTIVSLLRDEASPPLKVGIVGVTTEATPFTTMPANFVGLKMAEPALVIMQQAKAMREQGATVLIATMHIGSKCKDLHDANDLSSCEQNEELFKVLGAIPKGTLHVVVAGHTHAAMAHRINDVAVIESYSSGRAFGRVDLRINKEGNIINAKIHQPQDLCAMGQGDNPVAAADCQPGPYEGKPVVRDAAVQKIVDEALAKTSKLRNEPLGVTATGVIWKSYDKESPLGNLFTDLMLAAEPAADVAMTNGGGLRADIPAGPLTFGRLFEALPFDNRFALVTLQGKHIRRMIANNLGRASGLFSWGGVLVKATCANHQLQVDITVKGKPLSDNATYKLVTSDFLASGGDGVIGRLKLPAGATVVSDVIIRDAMVDILKRKKGNLVPTELYNPAKPRLAYLGQRPVSCADPNAPKPPPEEPD